VRRLTGRTSMQVSLWKPVAAGRIAVVVGQAVGEGLRGQPRIVVLGARALALGVTYVGAAALSPPATGPRRVRAA